MGDLLVLLAQFCYALYIVLYKDFVNKYSLVTIMKWMFTYSFICILPFSANSLMRTDWSSLHLPELGGLSFIVVGATFISYMLIVVGQKNLRPTVAGMYNYIQHLLPALLPFVGVWTLSISSRHGCYLHFRRCLSGYFEPEQEGTGIL